MNAKNIIKMLSGNKVDLEFDLLLNEQSIPYNPNPVFIGVTFDKRLCFNIHFKNLRTRALSRLNNNNNNKTATG